MSFSCQEGSTTKSGRTNQKARTRAALLQAAGALVQEGRPPSIPDAAERALVSVATAYRYFPSADDLWWEASMSAVAYERTLVEAHHQIDGAGADLQARLSALLQTNGFEMLDNQIPYRRIAKSALDHWLRQEDEGATDRVPGRQGRRNQLIAKVVEPLQEAMAPGDLERISRVLGLVVGTEAMIALVDGVGLDLPTAKQTLVDAGRWLLAGALAELTPTRS